MKQFFAVKLDQPLYSPDLATIDFFSELLIYFSNLKNSTLVEHHIVVKSHGDAALEMSKVVVSKFIN